MELLLIIISEFIKLTEKEYTMRHKKAEKLIYWQLCKRLGFDRVNQWLLQKLEFV